MRNDTDYISLLPTNMPRYLFFRDTLNKAYQTSQRRKSDLAK